MVSTRNAVHAPSSNAQSRVKQKNAAPRAVTSNSLQSQSLNPTPKTFQPAGSLGTRKRGRNDSITGRDAAGTTDPLGPSRKRRLPAIPDASKQIDSISQGVEPSSGQLQSNLEASDVARYGGPVDVQNSFQQQNDGSTDDSGSFLSQDIGIRSRSLPVLDNLATQMLSIIAKSSHRGVLSMMATPQTVAGQQWSQLSMLFTQTKSIYNDQFPFLSAQSLGITTKVQIETITRANLATFVCTLFGNREDIGFELLDGWFLETFSVDGSRFLKSHAQLYIELKTQAYISAITRDKAAIINGQVNVMDTLGPLFPSDLDQVLLQRHAGDTLLTPMERQFIDQAKMRSETLIGESNSEDTIDRLPSLYSWEAFLSAIQNYVKTDLDERLARMAPGNRRPGRPKQEQTIFRAAYVNRDLQTRPSSGPGNLQFEPTFNSTNDIAEKAARAAHLAMETFGTESQPNSSSSQLQSLGDGQNSTPQQQGQASQAQEAPIRFHFERPLHPNVPSPPAPFFTEIPYQNGEMQGQWHARSAGGGQPDHPYDAEGLIPYPTQSAPTHVLYERARQAASTKSSQQQTPRKISATTPAQRRPWTPDEENALMAGLDRVKGPHWSQIHAMFGPGGTINDVLKDRNQVQLKDKARNLKLFFLKSNIEVPYYLQFVTGELKTRAPSRAAKNEARQKAMSEEDRAHVEGVMTLAGTANTGEGSLDDAEGEETDRERMLRLAVSATNDVNIDPSLEAQLRQAAASEDAANQATLSSASRYTVPTPNMLMQNIEKFIGASNAADQSSKR